VSDDGGQRRDGFCTRAIRAPIRPPVVTQRPDSVRTRLSGTDGAGAVPAGPAVAAAAGSTIEFQAARPGAGNAARE